MFNFTKFLTKFIICFISITLSKGQINMTFYRNMPPLYIFEDYNECFHTNISNVNQAYCLTYVEIIPNNSSLLWQQIEEFSNSYQFHYRHDHLFRGMCLNNNSNATGIADTTWDTNLSKKQPIKIFNKIYQNNGDDFIKLHNHYEIETRLNQEFQREFNLSVQTFTLYCNSKEVPREKDFGFKFTISICFLIIGLNVLSSSYDGYLKSQQTGTNINKYYRINHTNRAARLLTSFSFYRNFCRLLRPNTSHIGNDLAFLDGFRSILSFLIVYEHSYYIQFVHLKNPEYFESLYHQFIMKVMLHGMVLVELFFVLSGLMLYIKVENGRYITRETNMGKCFKVYGRLILSRYLRLIPSLGFLILFNANILLHLQNGPFWRFMMETNSYFCSNYWWKNILLINNLDIYDSCLSHTWYLAADFQLYGFYLMILIFVAKYPKLKMRTFGIIAFFSATIPVSINYLLKLDSIAFMTLESFRYFYPIDVETGAQLYLPSYTNLHSFLLGIVCGEFYMKYIRRNPKAKKFIGNILKYTPYIGWPCIIGIFAIGTLALGQQSSIWTALYGLLQRHVTIIILTVTTILLMMSRPGNITKILSSVPFRLLARISYQVYLWHFNIVLMIANYFSQPINVTYYLMLIVLAMTYVNANIIALIFAITIEYPVAELLNIINLK